MEKSSIFTICLIIFNRWIENDQTGVVVLISKQWKLYQHVDKRMAILKLPATFLYYDSDEFNKICKIVSLYVSIQIADRISTGKSNMAIVHCWIRLFSAKALKGNPTTLVILRKYVSKQKNILNLLIACYQSSVHSRVWILKMPYKICIPRNCMFWYHFTSVEICSASMKSYQ